MTDVTETTEKKDSIKNSAFQFMSNSSPFAKFIRPLDHVDIYLPEHFNNEKIDATLVNLVDTIKTKKFKNNTEARCQAYNKLGIAYFRLFSFDKAEVCHQNHLMLSQASKLDMLTRNKGGNKVDMQIALVNLGCAMHAKRDYEISLEVFKEAMKIAEELNDDASMARIYSNMSNVYQDLCDFDAAIECERKRMKQRESTSDIGGQIKSAYSLGCLYQLIGETRISLEYYKKAVINLKMKIVTEQLREMNIIKPDNIGDEPGEVDSNALLNT